VAFGDVLLTRGNPWKMAPRITKMEVGLRKCEWDGVVDRAASRRDGWPAMKTCPFCVVDIQDAASVCKHCGRGLAPSAQRPRPGRATALSAPYRRAWRSASQPPKPIGLRIDVQIADLKPFSAAVVHFAPGRA
jgi:hypothetical protein